MNISIVYWSGTGNTEKMAELIAKGARTDGAQVSLKPVSQASKTDITSADAIALGCPSMGDEVLEESEFQPFVDDVMDAVSGKKTLLFGSYGWGDGQWMRDWAQNMESAGAQLMEDEGFIVNELPEGGDADACVNLGKDLAKS